MFLKAINISHFRNYDNLNVNFEPQINIIYGQNGSGKTNLLESIYTLGLTKSHRINIDNTLIKTGESVAYLKGLFSINKIDQTFEIGIDNEHKRLKVDKKIITKVSDYVSLINIIIFYPEDLNLIKGSPSERRRFLNLEISQLNSTYLRMMNRYNRILKMRNECLKQEKIDDTYLQILTNYLVEVMVYIYTMRKRFIDCLNENAGNIYKDIIKIDHFNLKYKPDIKFSSYDKEAMTKVINKEFERIKTKEIKFKMTLIGPNHDDFLFCIDENSLKEYGSQGQQRVGVLATKLSEIAIFEKYKKEKPILLLDDVFSELDIKTRNHLLKYIKKKIQTIITTTDLKSINPKIIAMANIIHISNGQILPK